MSRRLTPYTLQTPMLDRKRTTSPPPSPPAPPPDLNRTRTNPGQGDRPVRELEGERASMVAEADQLLERSRTAALTADESARLETCLASAERLDGEITIGRQRERLAAQRSRTAEPTRPPAQVLVPAVHVGNGHARTGGSAEAMRTWLNSFCSGGDATADARFRAAQHGFQIGTNSTRLDCNYDVINREKRRTLSKGGANLGADYIEKSYSQRVVEYISYFGPILNYVNVETTADGNDRDEFKIDDTSLESTFITASGGSELTPTIPDKNVATGAVTSKCYEITSGYHKLTRAVLRDSAVSLTDRVAKAIGNSHARKIRRELINGVGTTAPNGLLTNSTSVATIDLDELDIEVMEALYFSVPLQYRSAAIFVMSDTAQAAAVSALKDENGNSLFGKTIVDDVEIQTLFNRPVIIDEMMPTWADDHKPIMFVNPTFALLRIVAGQTLDVLTEKFYPHLAYASQMSFGVEWLGPSSANKCITLNVSG